MTTSPSEAVVPARSRQRLTLLFTDLSSSTRLGRAVEPEEYAELLEKVRDVWRLVAERYGGRIVRTQGDGALILFGFPELKEDDGRRAVEAALDIHEEVSRIAFDGLPSEFIPLKMHSGVHAGTVLLSLGDMERGRFDLTGDVANTTAHFSDCAQPGEVVASLEALGPHANFFELGVGTSCGTSASQSADVRVVLRRNGVHRRFDSTARRGLTPLIGRDSLVLRVADFLNADNAPGAAQQCCLVLVGPAGMGKTRLLEELVRHHVLPATVVLRGECESYLGAEVLQPFAQMVRSFFGVSATMRAGDLSADVLKSLRSWQDQLGPAAEALLRFLTSDVGLPGKRATTGGVVGDLLVFFTALSGQQPVLMLIDDWQWADDASLQLLGALLDAPAGPKVVLASRPKDDGEIRIQGAEHLYLTALDESATSNAVRRWLPYADPFLCAQIHEYSGGIPLFIEELCHSASAEALARAIENRGAAQNWLASLAVSRLERLPQNLAVLVRVAAVIGNEVPLWLMAEIVGYAPTSETLVELSDADFLHRTDAAEIIRFKHGITRDAVYQSIGLRERTGLHERVLTALLARSDGGERDDTIEALSHHSRGAGHWSQAAGFADRAGDKATIAFAMDRARVHYELAIHALDRIVRRTPEQTLHWCRLANKLGMTCVFDPLALGNDTSVFEKAVTLATNLGDMNALARAIYWLAYICYSIGHSRRALGYSREALRLARLVGDVRLAVQVEAMLGQVLAATSQYDEAVELIDVAVDAKRLRSRPRGGLAIGSAYALACKGGVLADRGEFPAAYACFDEAIDLLDGSTHPVGNSVRNWIAVAHNWQGNWPEASRIAEDSLRIAENTRALLLLSAARCSRGYAAWGARGSAGGLQELKEAMKWMDERHGRFFASIYFGWLVAGATTEGRFEEARGHAGKVFQRSRDGERMGEAVACRSLAWTAIIGGDQATAARWMRRAEIAANRRRSLREVALNQWMSGQIQMQLGQCDQALVSLKLAGLEFERMRMLWHHDGVRQQADTCTVVRPIFT